MFRNASIVESLESRQLMAGSALATVGGAGAEYATAVTTDDKGNIYITGEFNGKVKFGNKATLDSKQASDGFVAKYSPAGKLAWAVQFGKKQSYDRGVAIALDASGNVAVSGVQSGGGLDAAALVLKFDKKGKSIFNNSYVTNSSETLGGVAVDAKGAIYVTGSFASQAKFGGTTLTEPGFFSTDAFIVKLDKKGKALWAKQLGGTSNEIGKGIAVDAARNIYIVGDFGGTADFDPGAGSSTMTSSFGKAAFVTRLDRNGAFKWARQISGDSDVNGNAIALDGDSNAYITGFFAGTAAAGSIDLTSVAGTADVYAARIKANGDFAFATSFGGAGYDSGHAIAVNDSGVAIGGYFSGIADLKAGAGEENFDSVGYSNSFIVKLKKTGKFSFARHIVQTQQAFDNISGFNETAGLAFDADGNILAAGNFTRETDFNTGSKKKLVESEGENDLFMLKLNSKGLS